MRPETELFSSIFFEPNSLELVAPILRSEDFALDEHRALYESMLQLMEQGRPIDAVHVSERLAARGWSPEKSMNVIVRETDGAPMAGQARSYAVLVHEAARKRRLISAMELLQHRASEPGANPDALIEEFQQRIFELQSDRPEMELSPVRQAASDFLNQASAERKHVGELCGLSTGIGGLDVATTGFRDGELWIAGALPGRGKTSLAIQAAIELVSKDIPVLIFSLEMTAKELVRRIVGERLGAWNLRNVRSMSESQWSVAQEYAAEVAQWPLFIDDSASISALDLAARARLGIRQHKARLVIVDYLQLLRGTAKEIRERVGQSANSLRQLAKETGVPVLALSQLRRPGDLNNRPTMIDLKESGDIEAHAHTVLLLYMPTGQDGQPIGEDEIIIGKQRNGPIGSVPVYFDKRTLSFRERMKGSAA